MSAQQNSKTVTAAVVIIGNEILSGRTQDKNVAYIGEGLATHGIILAEVRIVADIREKIIKAVNELRAENDYVFTTGGIGPTHDDITAESIARAFGVEWCTHSEAYDILLGHYGEDRFTPARQRMAKTPAGAELVPNPVSGAPGFNIGNVYVMAGIPNIMRAMFDHILPSLVKGQVILSQTVVCCLQESVIAEGLAEVQGRYPDVDIGSYPKLVDGAFQVSLVLRGIRKDIIEKAVVDVVEMLRTHGDEPQVLDLT